MSFRLVPAGLCLALVAAAGNAFAEPAPVPALSTGELRCSRATVTAATNYLSSVFNARQACLSKVLREQLPSTVNCRASVDVGTGDDPTDDAIISAESKLAVAVQTGCLNVSIENLGFPGSCPDPQGPPYDSFDHEQCLLQKANEAVERLLEIERPPRTEFELTNEDLNCADTVALKSSSMFSKEVERRTVGCEQRRLEGTRAADVNCRAEIDPLAPGTGSTAIDSDILSAHNDVLRGIALACKRGNLAKVGFPHRCPLDEEKLFSVAALTECMYVSHHRRLIEFVDTLMPSTKMCGNCLMDVDNNEQCDDGDNDWEMGQVCRTDCSLVNRCGDPDDSGSVTVRDALFILRAAIALETCDKSLCDINGDGVLNSTDALLALRSVVGIGVVFKCGAATDLVCPVPPEE